MTHNKFIYHREPKIPNLKKLYNKFLVSLLETLFNRFCKCFGDYFQVSSGVLHGVLNISPEKIQAVDMDTINSPIYYTFVSGVPDSYKEYFRIDPDTGAVHQVKAVDTSTTKLFNIIIKVK